MSKDISSIVPPDDSGSKTFERYYYQAHIAFPYCLNCALGGNVRSVVLEHIEDVAVEFADGWIFLQIKTRDLERGPWKLTDLTCKGGALHSTFRTHKSLGEIAATLQVHVEGVVDRKDYIQRLLTPAGRADPELCLKLQEQLKISQQECLSLLSRFQLFHSHPTRETIAAQNLRLLVNHAGHVPAKQLVEMYERVLGLILAAMHAKSLPAKWKQMFLSKGSLRGDTQTRFEQKRLCKDHFTENLQLLCAPPQPLLKRIIDPGDQPPTLLEQKLLLGGASPAIIAHAKNLRANANRREYEVLSGQMFADSVLEDLENRLLIRADGLVSQYGIGKTPAATIWNQLLQVLSQQSAVIDSQGVFGRDPDLLLGHICHLSDQCRTNWGNADA